jgi:hypothetical protein
VALLVIVILLALGTAFALISRHLQALRTGAGGAGRGYARLQEVGVGAGPGEEEPGVVSSSPGNKAGLEMQQQTGRSPMPPVSMPAGMRSPLPLSHEGAGLSALGPGPRSPGERGKASQD